MSKKIIHFSKLFKPFVILSLLVIAFGAYGFFTRGLNMGLDFEAGLIQEVAVAPTALEISYQGPASVAVEASGNALTLVISGVGAENETIRLPYATYSTIGEVVNALNAIEGITGQAIGSSSASSYGLFGNSAVTTILSATPYKLYTAGDEIISIDQVRVALSSLPDVALKTVGDASANTFQIRVKDDGSDSEISKTIQDNIWTALTSQFGESNIAILKTDFIGSQFSSSLSVQAIILVLATLLLIWLYATIRFKWDFAVGAVLAIIHDALIMFTFIIWANLELNATMVAAVLTIIGYSINDTVVVLDRVRENVRTLKIKQFKDVLDISQTEILGRTIITTFTTLLAVTALYIFTTGSMQEFALALIVGMLSGVYSTIFIASSFIAFARRNWKPSNEEKKTQAIAVEVN
ncbi:MAG: protein translocase subunit SecF [Spirochaetales bacterium]